LGEVVARSSLYRTAPVGGPAGQADYLNAVVALRTGLSTHGLLRALQDVEERFGRVRGERWGPRTLDLDLLAHAAVNVDDPGETAEEMLARLDASGVERTELAW